MNELTYEGMVFGTCMCDFCDKEIKDGVIVSDDTNKVTLCDECFEESQITACPMDL